MRLWSLHPQYLDTKGLVACWREGLLARKVLLGETRGYRNHPQLSRFKSDSRPILLIDTYLTAILEDATARGYNFDRKKIGDRHALMKPAVTEGQLRYELEHLRAKLTLRDPAHLSSWESVDPPRAHSLFRVVPGEIEDWERPV